MGSQVYYRCEFVYCARRAAFVGMLEMRNLIAHLRHHNQAMNQMA